MRKQTFCYLDYWDREPDTWGSIKDWDLYLLKKLNSSQVNKRLSHSALGDELRCLKQMYDETIIFIRQLVIGRTH